MTKSSQECYSLHCFSYDLSLPIVHSNDITLSKWLESVHAYMYNYCYLFIYLYMCIYIYIYMSIFFVFNVDFHLY